MPRMQPISTIGELDGILSQPYAFVFINAQWSGPSVRAKQALENEWWTAIQKELGISQPVFEVDIDSDLFGKVIWPVYLEPIGRILGGAGEFLWFRDGKLIDVEIGTLASGFEKLLARTRKALNLDINDA